MIKMKAIIPKSLAFKPLRLALAVSNGLDAAAKGAQADLKVTTQTWNHTPVFEISAPDPATREIATDDAIFGYVDRGTRAHRIVARRAKRLRFQSGFRPKSRPGYIGSNKGRKGIGAPIFARAVNHPGTKARRLAKAVAEKWQKQLPKVMQRAIDAEVS